MPAEVTNATDANCIFCKIVRGEIPCRKAFEDEEILAFHDIAPVAPLHLLMVPKRHVATLYDTNATDAPLLGRMLAMAPVLARGQGSVEGFRTIINTGRVGQQEVQHVHIHVIGGSEPLGPMILRKRKE